MSQRDDRVSIRHALDAARLAIAGTASWNRDDLDLQSLPTLGILRLLEVIGEAANSVSPALRRARPEVPWQAMIGLRHRLIHGYFDVNLDVVWDTVRSDLPLLVGALERVLHDLDRGVPQ